MKKKILMLLGWYYPDSIGGTENYVRMLNRELMKLDYDLTVAAPTNDKNSKTYIYEGIPVFRYTVSKKPDKKEIRGEKEPEYFDEFKKLINNVKPDLVNLHSFTRGCGYYHAKYIKKVGIPLIFTVHVPEVICSRGTMLKWGEEACNGYMDKNVCTACFLNNKGVNKLGSNIFSLFPENLSKISKFFPSKVSTLLNSKKYISDRINKVRNICEDSTKIIVVCDWLYKTFSINNLDMDKVNIIKHGLSTELLQNNQKRKKRGKKLILGYIGRFNYIKGLHILLKAVKELDEDIPLELRVYGEPNNAEQQKYYRSLVQLVNNDKRINFLGIITEQNKNKLIRELDLLVVPSICLETGPLVILEAFANEVTVIGSNLGGIAENVVSGVNGFLYSPNSVKELKNIIISISDDMTILDKFSFEKVRNFKEIAEQTSEIYSSVLIN